ncbi:MAG: helix-turn-helix domain-containing protein [Ignavibacteriaceae bacterium]|nr:helix-turn-helix domain-containing protein [Ignavibacteriaceae bacterium]
MLNEHLQGVFNYSWRYIVVLNNLGLIEEAQENFEEAFNYFKKTLDYCYSNYKKGDSFNTTIYTLNRMGLIRLKENLFDESMEYLSEAEKISIESNNYNFLSNIYLNESKVFLKKGDLKSAIFYSEKAEKFTDKMESVGSFWRDFYFQQADIKNATGDFKNALEYHKKGAEISNKQIVQAEKSKSLLILASKNYEIVNTKLANSRRETLFFIIAFAIILIISIITIIYYIRLRRSNLKLVENVIQKSNSENIINLDKNLSEKNIVHDSNLIEISKNFKSLMETEKKFLDSEIDLEKAAELLGTNRTYLSKALNGILKINFNNYINSLRIKESIQFIKNGEAERLTIEGLANQVGFKHRSVFRRAFQKETGVTPSFFIDNYKETGS